MPQFFGQHIHHNKPHLEAALPFRFAKPSFDKEYVQYINDTATVGSVVHKLYSSINQPLLKTSLKMKTNVGLHGILNTIGLTMWKDLCCAITFGRCVVQFIILNVARH